MKDDSYIGLRDDENLNIMKDGKAFMKVLRRFDWFGRLVTNVYQEKELILATRRNKFFWYDKVVIQKQSLRIINSIISFEKIEGTMCLKKETDLFYLHEHYSGDPSYELYKNNLIIGEIHIPNIITLGRSKQYYIKFFENNSAINFYSLLLFVNQLYDVID